MTGLYLGLSVLCLFYFYHHPNHIGVVVTTKKNGAADNGFFMDALGTNLVLSETQI